MKKSGDHILLGSNLNNSNGERGTNPASSTKKIVLSETACQVIKKVIEKNNARMNSSPSSVCQDAFKVSKFKSKDIRSSSISDFRFINPEFDHEIDLSEVTRFHEELGSVHESQQEQASLVILDFMKFSRGMSVDDLWGYMKLLRRKNQEKRLQVYQCFDHLVRFLKFKHNIKNIKIPDTKKFKFLNKKYVTGNFLPWKKVYDLYSDLAGKGNFQAAVMFHLMFSWAMSLETISYLTFECLKPYGYIKFWNCSNH